MNAGEIMTRPVIAAVRDASAEDVASQLLIHRISGMPVVDEQDFVVGIITEADIITALGEGQDLKASTAETFMSNDPVSVDVDTPIKEVIDVFEELRVVRIPVTKNEKIVGIISRRDVIRSLLDTGFRTIG